MAYQPGMLNRRGNLELPVVTRSATGAEQIAWQLARRLPMAVLPIRGREYMTADQLRADVEVKIVIRFQPDLQILPTWRVVIDGAVHTIKSVINPASDRHWLELMCTAGVAQS